MALESANIAWPGWEVVRKLGEGSFGGVYEIQRMLPDGTVERSAMKKLSIPRDREEIDVLQAQSFPMKRISVYFRQQMEELVNEYTFMQELGGCPTVVSCQDIRCIQHDDGIGWDVYIRMELLEPLKKTITKKYSEYQVLRLGMDICRALLACESANIIHRDIKPENILVSETGRYKLGDFGIAKVSEKTETGTLTGTNGYMAPEVANRQRYGKEVDIYSLGMVLYWLMNNNTLPFLPMPPKIATAEQQQEAIARRLDGEPLPLPCNGSEELKLVVLKACAFNPEERYRSAREFGAALQRIFRNYKATDSDDIMREVGITEEMLTGAPGSSLARKQTSAPPEKNAGSAAAEQSPGKKSKGKAIALTVIALIVILAAGLSVTFMKRNHAEPELRTVSADAERETADGTTEQMTETMEVTETAEATISWPELPFEYEPCEDGIRITGWNETTPSEVVLPGEIAGLSVVEIGTEAFMGYRNLTAITIPESVTVIGERAFSGCSNLTEIELPAALGTLKKEIFSGCMALNQITIPDGVAVIEDGAFENCTGLASAELPRQAVSLGKRAFYGCSQLNDVTLPDELEEIGAEAFRNCENLSGIDIPESVVQIGNGAFFDCLMLTATVPVGFMDTLQQFMPESCEVTYVGIEKPDVTGEVGDIIIFGSYEQDNDLTNGSEPIEWQILEKDGTKIYVISKYGLDCQRYHDKEEIVCWENCKLRVWLNQTFYSTAFDAIEQSMIVTTDILSVHPRDAYPSKTVQDKVFLLDYEGAYGYFKSEKKRTCIATAYAQAQRSTVGYGGSCWWWLREGYFVDLASIPNTKRAGLTAYGGTVRPMICIETAS